MRTTALLQLSPDAKLKRPPEARQVPRSASKAIFAFRAASIFRLVLFVILRSVCRDGTARTPISQPVPIPGSTSPIEADVLRVQAQHFCDDTRRYSAEIVDTLQRAIWRMEKDEESRR